MSDGFSWCIQVQSGEFLLKVLDQNMNLESLDETRRHCTGDELWGSFGMKEISFKAFH